MKQINNTKILRIAFGAPWNNVNPGLQHTLIGDLTLSNQFESLVSFYEDGTYGPMAAKEWIQSSDFKKLTFKIDTSRKFSDGVNLSAQHFKDSWERALKLEPKSANKSALDVLYKVEGYNDFENTSKLSGIRILDNETLEISFSTPFRMALEHLGGNRFSAFREVNGKFLGTGAFVIEELNSDNLVLRPNQQYSQRNINQINLSVVSTKDSIESLLNNTIDVLAYGIGSVVPSDIEKHKNLSVIVGQDAIHRSIYVNSAKGLFSKKEFRQALQYLSMKYYKENAGALGNTNLTAIDPQVFLPLQAGRLDSDLVEKVITKGKKYVRDLQLAAKKNPIKLLETEEYSLKPFLKACEIEISADSKILTKQELIKAIYKGDQADIMPGSFGVASGDPDGIYHVLGEKGAITSPMLANKAVSSILEEGRQIVEQDKIAPFYQKVSLVILDEAPIIHLGFNKSVAIYRNDKVDVKGRLLRRNAGHLHIFKAK